MASGNQLRAEVKNKSLLGEWLYEVSEAPYGYEKGSLIFSEKDGQTVCIVKLEAGELATSELKLKTIKFPSSLRLTETRLMLCLHWKKENLPVRLTVRKAQNHYRNEKIKVITGKE